TYSFQPGGDIIDRARNAIAIADKVLVVYSAKSVKSDWVRSEIALAEELERRLGMHFLVYLRLDQEPLLAHDVNRISIDAIGKSVREVGNDLLHAITGRERRPDDYRYIEDEPLVSRNSGSRRAFGSSRHGPWRLLSGLIAPLMRAWPLSRSSGGVWE